MTMMKKVLVGITAIMMSFAIANGAIVVDFHDGAATGNSTVVTFDNLGTTPTFNGGVFDDSASMVESTLSSTPVSGSVTASITMHLGGNPSGWTFDPASPILTTAGNGGVWGPAGTGYLFGSDVMLIDFDASGLTLGAEQKLMVSFLRVNATAAALTVNQDTGASSGTTLESLGAGDDAWTTAVEIPLVDGVGTEIALQAGSKWTGISQISIDVISVGPPDTDAPTPNPATWAVAPAAISPFSIEMTATTGTDESAIEYYFDETSGNIGGTDSGWQSNPTYTDFGLQPSNTYSYTVQMRDTAGNTGDVSIVSSATTPEAEPGRTNGPPNIVFIYADDLGYADIGYNASVGSLAYTPNIDRICSEGIYLSNYLTHHVCTPSRAGLLTGKHYTRVGSGMFVNGTLDNSIPNIAKDFQAAGYATGCFGKWHSSEPNEPTNGKGQLGSFDVWSDLHNEFTAPLDNDKFDKVWQQYPWGETVNAYGFDRYVGFFSGGVDYFDKYLSYYRDINWWHDGDYVEDEPGYLTDLISQHSLDFVDANRDVPFFCYVPHGAVHAPYDVTRTDLEEMCHIWGDEYPALAWDNVKMLQSTSSTNLIRDVEELRCTPGYEFDREALDDEISGFADLIYYTMIYSMDKATGAMLDRLDVLGLTTNTIVIFSSDNGGVINRGDNGLFRGGKVTIWEGGIHVPSAIWWPGQLDANQAPYSAGDNVYSNLTQYFDWYPTLIGMTGQELNGTDLDGIDLTSSLFNRTSARPDFDNCYFGLDDYWASVHSGRWKLHFNRVSGTRSTLLLYDLLNDPGESSNVASSNPVERDALIALMDQWFSSGDVTTSYMPLTGDSLPPYSNPAPDGEILEVKATQTGTISNRDQGVSVGFSKKEFKGVNIYDYYIQASDIIEYDIYVAGDSDHNSGMFCSPSRGSEPLFDTDLGVHPSGSMLFETSIPTGQWVRVAAGVGDIAPGSATSPQYIGLFNPAPGYYHFYLDNVVIRRNDGTIRVMVWNSGSDTDTTPDYYYNGVKTSSLPAAAPFSSITLTTQNLSVLGSSPESGMNYNDWAAEMGGVDGLDPTASGPINQWSLMKEYGLGSDPLTYTAGFLNSTNAPNSSQLGTYSIKGVSVEDQVDDYFTMSFDFNREAKDIEIVLQESSNLVDWVDALVLQPPYSDVAGAVSTNAQVVEVFDNLEVEYPVPTTRITARTETTIEDADKRFLKLEVRSAIEAATTPLALIATSHNGILVEWSGGGEQELYTIERAASGSGSFLKIAETENYQYLDTTAVGGQTYDYRVRAMNIGGVTAWSNTATATR